LTSPFRFLRNGDFLKWQAPRLYKSGKEATMHYIGWIISML